MGIKAATGFTAGVPDYVAGGPPAVPSGYTRYITNIATADTTTNESFLFGIAVEDGMSIDIPSYFEVLLVGGFATGFVVIPQGAPTLPLSASFYYFYPSNSDYLSEPFQFILESGDGVPDTVKVITYSITRPITSKITYKITSR